jgi:hypothetical protein
MAEFISVTIYMLLRYLYYATGGLLFPAVFVYHLGSNPWGKYIFSSHMEIDAATRFGRLFLRLRENAEVP